MQKTFSAESVEKLIAASKSSSSMSEAPSFSLANTIVAELKSLIQESNYILSALKTQLHEVQNANSDAKSEFEDEGSVSSKISLHSMEDDSASNLSTYDDDKSDPAPILGEDTPEIFSPSLSRSESNESLGAIEFLRLAAEAEEFDNSMMEKHPPKQDDQNHTNVEGSSFGLQHDNFIVENADEILYAPSSSLPTYDRVKSPEESPLNPSSADLSSPESAQTSMVTIDQSPSSPTLLPDNPSSVSNLGQPHQSDIITLSPKPSPYPDENQSNHVAASTCQMAHYPYTKPANILTTDQILRLNTEQTRQYLLSRLYDRHLSQCETPNCSPNLLFIVLNDAQFWVSTNA